MIFRRKSYALPTCGEPDPPETDHGTRNTFKGLFLALVSGIFFSIAAVIVKKMKNLHPAQLSVYRFIAIVACSLPAVVYSRQNIIGPRNLRTLLALRGIFGATNLFLNFVAFRYLPLGEAAVIIFSVPVFVTVAARVYLKEPCGAFQSVIVLLAVVGIVLTTKIPQKLSGSSPPYTRESLYGLLAAVAALLFSTCRFLVLRKVKAVHYAVIMFSSSCVSLLETSVLTLLVGDFRWVNCGLQGWYIVAMGFVSYVGQTLLTKAVQYEFAGPVSTMRAAADIVLSFVWQTVLFHDVPDALSVFGALLVGVSVVFVGFLKYVSTLPAESSLRKSFAWAVPK